MYHFDDLSSWQLENRKRLREICFEQDRERRSERVKELKELKKQLNDFAQFLHMFNLRREFNERMASYEQSKIVRKNELEALKKFVGLNNISNDRREYTKKEREATRLELAEAIERLRDKIKHIKLKDIYYRARKLEKPENRENKKVKTKNDLLSIYSCNARSMNNKLSSVKEIVKSGAADIFFFSELNMRKVPNFVGHHTFTCYSNKRFHGVTAICGNHMKGDLMRIPHEDSLEIVHLLLKSTNPMTHILGVYLDVESRTSVAKVSEAWSSFTRILDDIISKGEAVITIGDMNRPIDKQKPSHGTKLLMDYINTGTVALINNPEIPTRIDPSTKAGSVLDLCIVSKNIHKSIKSLTIDTNKSITPFSMSKSKGVITPKYTDHLAMVVETKVKFMVKSKGGKIPVINLKNKEGWKKYEEISNQFAHRIREIVEKTEDPDVMEREIQFTDIDLQIASFGITWQGPSKKKKKKQSSKDLRDLYREHLDDLNEMLKDGIQGDNLNNKMYKLRDIIEGPKIKPQEPMAINDPKTGELVTDNDEIKRISLEHNIKILTKNAPREQDRERFEKIKEAHEKAMNEPDLDAWELEKPLFKKVTEKIKLKNKTLYNLFNKAGAEYKDAIFLFMAKLIKTEKIPKCFLNTSLTQIWKKKGSALDLNNMRFIHTRHWRSKLIEALVTEKMKDNIVQATPNIQLGGMPGAASVEHLVVLKTWMKFKEEKKEGGILCTYDMSKFFDKEPLCDVMYTLKERAKIDNKCYRLWYILNENTCISVKTSVGETKCAICRNTIGQGLEASALASSCNIGCAIADTFENEYSTKIGDLILHTLIFQDDIAKLNDNIEDARKGCNKIDETLKQKLLSTNYDKSKYLIIGGNKARMEMIEKLKDDPIRMGDIIIENAKMEKYLGDLIHELGCAQSIKETIKERMRTLVSKVDEIIKTSESPWIGGLNNSETPFKLFEARVIPSLLHNSESWIGITKDHIKDLQDFQDSFIRRVLHLAPQTTKAIINWDIGMMPMKWRIAGKKLQFVRKIMMKEDDNITKKALHQEVITGIKGLAHECKELTDELEMPNIMLGNTPKALIKRTIAKKVHIEFWNAMENSKKVRDRLTFNPADNTYIKCLSLPLTRVWFRYRARAIPKVKGNYKQSHSDLSCTLCSSNLEMNQEHLETCEGTEHERRGLDMGTWRGLLDFWRRMIKKLEATVT